MGTIKILIIEDSPADSNKLKAVLIQHHYEVVGVATTFAEALKIFYEKTIDLVVIDVFLNGKPDGIKFAETITITPNVLKPFVFLTSSKDRQIFESAKLTHPFSFLMKPFNELEVLYAIEMAVEKFYFQKNIFSHEEPGLVMANDYIFIKKNKSLKKVLIADISYVEVEGRYCNIITENEKFVILISLIKINALLQKNRFIRTHRNYLVNADKITEIIAEDNLIILKEGHKVLLSEKYKNFVNNFDVLK
jgi:DNA-binding LytR/AlgR family response regulator